jgi:hypothetical protein
MAFEDGRKEPVSKVSSSTEDQQTHPVTVLRNDPVAKAAFLATFTPEEEKMIMRKVDRRFLLLIGLMYMIKTVRKKKITSPRKGAPC